MTGYVHLHVRSHYSLPGIGATVESLATSAYALGMTAIALTDLSILSGIPDLVRVCSEVGLKPIVGMEVGPEAIRGERVVLLARDGDGYRSLSRLSTRLQCEPDSGRSAWEDLLSAGAAGLICLSGCRGSRVHTALALGQLDEASEVAGRYCEVFGPEGFYLQLERPEPASDRIVDLARRVGARVVATCDVLRASRATAGEDDQHYLKSPLDMALLYRDMPEALNSSLEVAGACAFELPRRPPLAATFPVPDGQDPDTYLRSLARQGMEDLGAAAPDANGRLEQELFEVARRGLAGLYLLAWDLVRFARGAGIAVSHCRGAASGSLVLYCLGVTGVDPLRHGLMFERFLRDENDGMPSLEFEVSPDRRGELGAHLRDLLGDDHVARLATFRRVGPRAAVQRAARVEGCSPSKAAQVGRLVSPGCSSISDALAGNRKLRRWADRVVGARIIFRAKALEQVVEGRHVHSTAIALCREPMADYVPLAQDRATGEVTTQFAFDEAAAHGLVRLDILGLCEVAIADEGMAMAGAAEAHPEDDLTFAMLRSGDTSGVWLLESAGMRKLLRAAKPRSLDDLAVLLGFAYPYPEENARRVARRMSGREPIPYPLAVGHEVLGPTYGELLYQEQVMDLAQRLAGLSYAEADRMRRALGRRAPVQMAAWKQRFVLGALERALAESRAMVAFEYLCTRVPWCVSKAYAVSRCRLVYRLAWLKANHPAELTRARRVVRERLELADGRSDHLLHGAWPPTHP